MGDILILSHLIPWLSWDPRPMHFVKALASKSLHKWSTGWSRVTAWMMLSIFSFADRSRQRDSGRNVQCHASDDRGKKNLANQSASQMPNKNKQNSYLLVIKRGNGNPRSTWRFLARTIDYKYWGICLCHVWLPEGPFIGWDASLLGRFPEPYHHLSSSFTGLVQPVRSPKHFSA